MDYGALRVINLIQPLKIHVCLWLYFGIGILWFISSITLITSRFYFTIIISFLDFISHFRQATLIFGVGDISPDCNLRIIKEWRCRLVSLTTFFSPFKIILFFAFEDVRYTYLRHANIFLYFWIIITTAISILDLGLGIALGLDYDTLRVIFAKNLQWWRNNHDFFSFGQQHSHGIHLDNIATGEHPQFIINPAKSAALILMSVAFRGYVLWLINVGLCIYFFTQTLKISDYNRLKVCNAGHMPQGLYDLSSW